MKKYILFTLVIISLFYGICCKKNPVASPTPPDLPDTTSHNFTWQIDTIGTMASVISDVAIVNENDIWAVGSIYMKDSTGQIDPILYNAAHWNGNKWEFIRIYYNFAGQSTIADLSVILAFSKNDIWFGVGNLIHYNGSEFIAVENNSPFASIINKMWGLSTDNFYLVGVNGIITHYDGSNWINIPSGTTLPFQDIWGAINAKTGEQEILAIASDRFGMGGEYLVKIKGNIATHLNNNFDTDLSLSSVWFVPNQKYFLGGSGIWTKEQLSDSSWQLSHGHEIARSYSYSIRGAGLNDIVISGEDGNISHYNGST